MTHHSTRTGLRNVLRTVLAMSLLTVAAIPQRAQAQASGSVEIVAMVVARATTTLTQTGGTSVRAVAGGVVVVQQMALSSNVDSQTLEAMLLQGGDAAGVTVSVRCGGGVGNCRLSGGETPRIAVEVSVAGLSAEQVQAALAAPDRFAARVSYRLVRGEGT